MTNQQNSFRSQLQREDIDQLAGTEVRSRRRRFSKVYALGGNRFQAVTYAQPVHHYNTRTHEWDEIDNRFVSTPRLEAAKASWRQGLMPAVDRGDALLECRTGSMEVACGMSGAAPFITLTDNEGRKLAWGVEDAMSILPETSAINDAAADSVRALREQVLERLHGEVMYSGVFAGVDLRCKLDCSFKDELIFAAKESVRPVTFLMESEGRQMELAPDGTLCVMDQSGKPVFRLASPYLKDAEDHRGEVAVTLEARADGIYALTCTPDAAFAEAAVYPLVLDPEVQTAQDGQSIVDTWVQEGSTTDRSNADRLWATEAGSAYGLRYAYLRVKELPPISSSDFITSARLHLQFIVTHMSTANSADKNTPVRCREVTSAWEPETITFDTQPETAEMDQDYCVFPTNSYSWQSLDVTGPARRWYLGQNYGVRLANDPYAASRVVCLYSSQSGSTHRPYLTVNYQSLGGLEPHLSYDRQNGGLSGTGAVNLACGSLVYSHPDTAMNGSRMPVSITHHYGSAAADRDDLGLGYGWRTTLHQTLHKTLINGSVLYVHTDGDGTEHWFEQGDDGKYTDLSGLTLTLEEITDDSGSLVRITSKGDAGMDFPAVTGTPSADAPDTDRVLLRRIFDAKGNEVIVTPRPEFPLQVLCVTDGAGRVTHFDYAAQPDSVSRCTAIRTPWQTANACTRFTYDDDGCLTGITHEDDRVSTYAYDTRGDFHLLKQATGSDGLAVRYAYANTGAVYGLPYCVTSATTGEAALLDPEAANPLITASTAYEYGSHLTLVTDQISNKALRYHFNDRGCQISVDDGLGYAVYTEYDQSGENANAPINHPTTCSRMQKVVHNLLRDHAFEGDGSAWITSGDAAFTRTSATRQWGLTSQQITLRSGTAALAQTINLTPGAAYTLSGFGKSGGPRAVLTASCTVSGGEITFSTDPFPVLTDADAEPFVRQACSFRVPENADGEVTIAMSVSGDAGSAWFDCLQLEEGLTCNHYNMLENSNFTRAATGADAPANWTRVSTDEADLAHVDVDATAPEHLRTSRAARVRGRLERNILVNQDLRVTGNAGDRYSVGGWCRTLARKATEDGHAACRILVQFCYGHPDTPNLTPTTAAEVVFNPGEAKWQFGASAVTAPIRYTWIRVSLQMLRQINYADFTGLFLYPEPFGTDYVYDEKGNRTSALRLCGGVSSARYDDHNNLIRHTAPGHTLSSTFSYGDTDEEQKQHLLRTSSSPLGTQGDYAYDAFGNATRATTTCDALATRTSTAWTADGNYAAQQTDARGKTVHTVTDPQRGTTASVTDPRGQRVDYEYDSLRRVKKVLTQAGESTYRNEYIYHDSTGQLTSVRHNVDGDRTHDVVYTFGYDALGRKTTVHVGNALLSANQYQTDPALPNYGTLTRMTYGNGTEVSNEYDDFNRVTGVRYGDETTPRYAYVYNANGQVAHVTNALLNQITESEYDLSNRPCRIKVNRDVAGVRSHVYTGDVLYDDLFDRLSEFRELIGPAHTLYRTTFGYDAENRPTALNYGDHGSSAIVYDGLGRVASTSVTAGSGAAQTTTYTYVAGAELEDVTDKASTTGLVESISQTGGNFTYTYDDNGNIVSVVQDGVTTSYTYDALGQLIRVVDGQEGATWEYTYDQGGNILSKKKFVDGVETECMSFTYGNTNWRDQLTAVNGTAITYDQIGNPLNDGTWQYTWQNGRQLARMQKSDVDAAFVYNENGLRVQKTVNSVVTDYTLHGKNIVHMTCGDDELHFFYDAQNRPAVVVYNGVAYSYVKNLQGDIVAILDSTGAVVVAYTYDAWGKPIGKTGTMASTLGTVQPFRYRSYVYDEETGLYYLRSRYYSPGRNRFLNADTVFHGEGMPITAQQFSYCDNSPVITIDADGQVWVMGAYAKCYAEFHIEVQKAVMDRNIGMKMEVPLGYQGWRADLVYHGAIYEVKPKRDHHIVIGTAQVARYVAHSPYTVGVEPLQLPDPKTWDMGNRTITMYVEQMGCLILYSFEIKQKKKQTVPVTVPAVSPAEARKRSKPSLPPLVPEWAGDCAGTMVATALAGGGTLAMAYLLMRSANALRTR